MTEADDDIFSLDPDSDDDDEEERDREEHRILDYPDVRTPVSRPRFNRYNPFAVVAGIVQGQCKCLKYGAIILCAGTAVVVGVNALSEFLDGFTEIGQIKASYKPYLSPETAKIVDDYLGNISKETHFVRQFTSSDGAEHIVRQNELEEGKHFYANYPGFYEAADSENGVVKYAAISIRPNEFKGKINSNNIQSIFPQAPDLSNRCWETTSVGYNRCVVTTAQSYTEYFINSSDRNSPIVGLNSEIFSIPLK